jgi:hypothetical protein
MKQVREEKREKRHERSGRLKPLPTCRPKPRGCIGKNFEVKRCHLCEEQDESISTEGSGVGRSKEDYHEDSEKIVTEREKGGWVVIIIPAVRGNDTHIS